MGNIQEKISLYLSAALYLLFNLRLGVDITATLTATLWQIVQTAPYVAGIAYVIIALLQYMAEGEKLPWDRRLRLFFAIGILAGLFFAIYEYAGTGAGIK
ncbi:MAG: hypothetical protein KJ630_02295 [Proteobacteria bacterium]|nr:hypothetical protein [Pseudomonadota bacterium]